MPTDASPTDPVTHEALLRPATEDDVAALADLYLVVRRSAEPAMPPVAESAVEVRAHTARIVAEHEVWLAESDEQVLAFATLADDWLDSLYVHPAHQGAGLGSDLLDLVKARRPDGFSLWVFETNRAARRFYARHGLVELEHTDGSGNAEHAPDVRMAWPGTDPLGFLRRQIDAVDDELARLLARRTAITAAVQDHKASTLGDGGTAARDPAREAEIVARMARLAPALGRERLARVMQAVIAESLAAWESGEGPGLT